MTEQAFDALLRKALMEAVMEDLGPVWDGELPADPQSPRQRRRMLRLLRDPCRVVRRRARPVWKRGLRAAVCAVLISAALFAATIAAVPQARAWVKELWSQWFETHTKYESQNSDYISSENWRLLYLPIGYSETQSEDLNNMGTIFYTSNDDLPITFRYSSDKNSFSVDNEHSDYSQAYLKNGTIAELYISLSIDRPSHLLCTTPDDSVLFFIEAYVPKSELIKIADGIGLSDK